MTDRQLDLFSDDGNFESQVDSDESSSDVQLTGYRLDRLEVYNWGTFDKKVYTLILDGKNCLMTGNIGSGKSTIVDAITTLLLPHSKIAYNKAAGAELKERNLLSYVLGHHKSTQNELTGSTKPVSLRDQNSYSVILGVFRNNDFDKTITLAQVFWLKDSQSVARLYATAEKRLSIAEDFSNFGVDIASLKKRLKNSFVEVHDSFPPYGAWFRRRFGNISEQAMDLFHQTVSMKSVGSVTGFVRTHMLEPFDVETRIAALLSHFDDLNSAHEAVQKAARQVQLLTPLVADCTKHANLTLERENLGQNRDYLKPYFAKTKRTLLEGKIATLSATQLLQQSTVDKWKANVKELKLKERELQQSIFENGGNRIEQIKVAIERAVTDKLSRKRQFDAYEDRARLVDLSAPKDSATFEHNRFAFEQRSAKALQQQIDLENLHVELSADIHQQKNEHQKIADELISLRARRNSIPKRQIDLQETMCKELGLSVDEIPFVGELIQVRETESEWEGSIERILHHFGLSLLVPEKHYVKVCDYVERTHLKGKLVYYRIKKSLSSEPSTSVLHTDSLVKKIDIKRSSLFYDWLEHELFSRFDYACCASPEQFRRELRAVTRSGQVKSPGNRHEKDDRHRIDDRSQYILGWSNATKISALSDKEKHLSTELKKALTEVDKIKNNLSAMRETLAALSRLSEFTRFEDIDWQSSVKEIAKLENDLQIMESSSNKLKQLNKDLEEISVQLQKSEQKHISAEKELATIVERIAVTNSDLLQCEQLLQELDVEISSSNFEKLDAMRTEILGDVTTTVENCDKQESEFQNALNKRYQELSKIREELSQVVVSAMTKYRHAFPQETSDVDDSVDSAPEYAKMLDQLQENDLPRFQARFKEMLNENTIREVAQFQSHLEQQRLEIKDNIAKINASLTHIDYSDGRYICLETKPTMDVEVRDFQQELKNCTDGTLEGSDEEQYSENKFLQVKALIERFRGREGLIDLDKNWTKKVIDVRNAFVYCAAERYRSDDTVFDYYADSDGKSGGQKEKLAYTILAASLAYQFGLQWNQVASRSFRFVVIDEAFGRGSDESAKFGLNLFKQLQLQLLVVTPMQKVKVIEPFVNNVGFVHNDDGSSSKIRNMTIEEYHEKKASFIRDVDQAS